MSRAECILILLIFLSWATSITCSKEQCPKGPGCTPCKLLSRMSYVMYCGRELNSSNESYFQIEYTPYIFASLSASVAITCINSPKWSDFHLGVTKQIQFSSSVSFIDCDIPEGPNLNTIRHQIINRDATYNLQRKAPFRYTTLETLRVNSNKNLTPSAVTWAMSGYENISSIDLRYNGLKFIPSSWLNGFHVLQEIDLGFNDLSKIPYVGGQQMNTLKLQQNNIKIVRFEDLEWVMNLRYLDLSRNQIAVIEAESFSHIRRLEFLDLSENNFMELPVTIFYPLTHLKYFNISRNNFSNQLISTDDSDKTGNVEKLLYSPPKEQNLTFAGRPIINSIQHLRVVEIFNLTNLGITYFSGKISTSRSLKLLTLANNYLKTLPDTFFTYILDIEELNLSNNIIEYLPEALFKPLNNLKKLDLSKNRIRQLNTMFNEFSVQIIDMSYNQITFIDKNAFEMANNLRIINFSNNQIIFNESSTTSFENDKRQSPFFYSTDSLEELYLNNNNISEIYHDWLSAPYLKVLQLKNNQITNLIHSSIRFNSFETVQLDLSGNRISRIDLSGLESKIDFYPTVRVKIANNPVECDCSIYHLLRNHEKRMTSLVQRAFDISLDNLTCAGPPERHNSPVASLNSRELQCQVSQNSTDNPMTCPRECKCSFLVENQAFSVNCSHRRLTKVPYFNPGSSHYTELNLEGNCLKKFPPMQQPGLDNVTILFLSHNQISNFSVDDLSKNFVELHLHGNNLTKLTKEVIEFLGNSTQLRNLSLHGNPWQCGCDTLDFLDFIQEKQSTWAELNKVACNSSDTPVFKMSSIDMCPLSPTTIIWGAFVFSVLLGIVALIALYYRYETEIKVWLFAHRLLPWFVNEADVDRDKVYDAFVSYSHQDEDFVVNELVPKLEEGPHAFKLCIHYRDWLVGEFIAEQIARSVEDSRRTVVVLSRNFLESEWGRMEFRTAHCNALKEGRARVIVIIYGDIGPVDELEPELKSYLRTNTYVQWGDRWFWEKLRYALPHPVDFVKKSKKNSQKVIANNNACNYI